MAVIAAHERDGHERQNGFFSLDGLSNGKGELTVGPDTDVSVEAQENRSTGFSWYIKENTCGARFEMSQDIYTSHPRQQGDEKWGKIHGSAGKRTWIFSTLGEDSNYMKGLPCQVTFIYKRPWLKD